MDQHEGGDNADRPYWLSTPQQDFTALVDFIMPEVEARLRRDGVFAPFGALMAREPYRGDIELHDEPMPDKKDGNAQLDHLKQALRERVGRSYQRAAVVAANCTVLLPGSGKQAEAAVLMCTHRDGTAANFVYPYTITNGRVTFAPLEMAEGTQDIFPPIRLRPWIRESCPPRPVGYKVGLFLFHGLEREAILHRMHLSETGRPEGDNPAPAAIASLPDGWTVVWFNDPAAALHHATHMETYAAGCTVLSLFVDEPDYVTQATGHANGAQLWTVRHVGTSRTRAQPGGPHDLHMTGTPPAQLATIVTAMRKEEADSGYLPDMIDFYFDIPVELIHALTGFQYCQRDYDNGRVTFDTLLQGVPEG
ncbi:hypothetical protein ACM0P6_02055 [Komagataeibacter sucrofermentans]|uniref:Uncharacterized protein n=1 Tax=Komagataeibacter sucrofermentans TaxID=1053551 RepID=A0A318QMW3_9PROT|nr:hypothetical protein [Komagataeibacter sucrofermentans]PYD78828.1 hypothetical protein CFR77_09890 [Komagataeibacter sucrofermentans]GBQ49224.1 hypothetical protein AA15973_1693 [Komagataeibacter sucrofermentans DSM 15973]